MSCPAARAVWGLEVELDGKMEERSGADWNGTGRDGTNARTENGERDGERSGGTERVRPLRLDAPIPHQRALPYITGAVG